MKNLWTRKLKKVLLLYFPLGLFLIWTSRSHILDADFCFKACP